MDKVRLGSVMTLHRGYDLPNAQRKPGNVPVISSSGISGSHSIAKLDGENVITGRYGTIGEVFYHSGPCWPLNTTLFVENFHGNDPKYVAYLLEVMLNALQIDGTDKSTVPGVDRNVLHDLTVPYISGFESQKAVTTVLAAIDGKIANNKKLMTELEETARLIYDYWFTQFDFPDENGKPYRSSGGEMVWSDELKREIPAQWAVGKTGDMIEGIRTGLNPRTNFTLKTTGIAYLTVKNITSDGNIDFSGCDFIDERDRVVVHRRSDVSKGDILFASIAPLGRCYLVRQDPEKWDINESVFSVRPNAKTSTSEFLYLLLTSDWFIKAAEGSSAGSIFKGIRNEELRNLNMALPDMETILLFTERTRPLLDQIGLLQDESRELVRLRNWLLPMLMNGQLVVD